MGHRAFECPKIQEVGKEKNGKVYTTKFENETELVDPEDGEVFMLKIVLLIPEKE